jgi:hypothetical protein
MGGGNGIGNIVRLTAKEHYLCHRLLCEIYPYKNGLVFAYWMMCKVISNNQQRGTRISAREYDRLKSEYSRVLKERIPWNKGLTKDDERVAKYSNTKRWNSGLKKGDNPILDELHRKSAESRKGKKRPEHSVKLKELYSNRKMNDTI